MMLPIETLRYILNFLARTELPADAVGYTADAEAAHRFKVVIRPSRFFDAGVYGTAATLPATPLTEVDGVPILFGCAKTEMDGTSLVTEADIVASTFFLITRYEELIVTKRDVHGRFAYANSILSCEQLRFRAVVDEYGKLLRSWLRRAGVDIAEPEPKLGSVTLTHDVDILTAYRRPRGFFSGLKRSVHCKSEGAYGIFRAINNRNADPAFTFQQLIEIDNHLPEARKIYFIKSAIETHRFDKPQYKLNGKDFRHLLNLIRANGDEIGLHNSYFSGQNPQFVAQEKAKLEAALGCSVSLARYHYLRTCSLDDFRAFVLAGITDDFTLGFADCATFRLGTSRAVRWIDPKNLHITPLTLHPLMMMDVSLSGQNYMNLPVEKALAHAKQLIDTTKQHGGDLCLLWHNNNMSPVISSYNHAELYTRVIDYVDSCQS